MHTGRKNITVEYEEIFSGQFSANLCPRWCEETIIQLIGGDVAIVTVGFKNYDVFLNHSSDQTRDH